MTDPITDMLNHIRNAQAVGKTDVSVAFSRIKNEIALMLSKAGFIGEVKKSAKGKVKTLKMNLKYQSAGAGEKQLPQIAGLKRVSKPGQRIYVKFSEIKKVRGGLGLSIISTPKGLMTGMEAKKAKLGGEVLLEVW